MRRHSLFQPADESLKIDVRVLLPQFRLSVLLYRSIFFLLFGIRRVATAERDRGEKKKKDDFFHDS